MNITAITNCRECGSEALTWDTYSMTESGVPEGRLRSREVEVSLSTWLRRVF